MKYTNEEITKSIQRIELEILKDLIKVFEKQNIVYFIAGGTLLGSVRHNGFIPWDDDIDLYVPRPDYEYFLENFESFMPDKYRLIHKSRNSVTNVQFAKIQILKTGLENELDLKLTERYSIWIDVFPLDGAGNQKNRAQYHLKRLIHFRKMINNSIYSPLFTTAKPKKVFVQKIYRLLSILIPIQLLYLLYKKTISKFNFDDSKYLICSDGGSGIRELFDKELIFKSGQLKELTFCETKVKVPFYYEKFLEQIYGDYMELPPLEKRVGEHYNFDLINKLVE